MPAVRLISSYLLKVFLLIAAISVVLTGCRAGNSEPVDPEEFSALLVMVETVRESDHYSIQREFIGRVEATRRTRLGFELPGEIREIHVDEGDTVAAGDVLARLDTARLEARLAEARAAYDQAVSARDFAVRSHQRRKEAAASGGISEQAVDEALDKANAARAGVAAADARLNSVEVDLRKSKLTAPYDAVIVKREIDEGNIVAAGNTVLFLQELAAPEIRVGVAGDIAAAIATDDQYEVSIGTQRVNAVVRAVLPVRNPATRTIDVILTLDQGYTVYPGDIARISVEKPVIEPGFWLPLTALAEGSRGLWRVNIVTPIEPATLSANGATHIVEPRSVEVLYKQDEIVFVRGALTDGEQYIVSGTQRIVPYQHVRVTDAYANAMMPVSSHD